MERARRHHRLLSAAAFALLLVAAAVAGRWLTAQVDGLLHVGDPISASARYTPFLLLGVKIGSALLAARLAWRFVRAHATARAGRRLLTAVAPAPRLRLRLSPRLWLAAFGTNAVVYLAQADLERSAATLSPWLHTYALPVFALLAVVVAAAWGAVAGWLAEYESYAEETYSRSRRLAAFLPPRRSRLARDSRAPRRLHGLAFESRPPPAAA
jgi:hypothetical protein